LSIEDLTRQRRCAECVKNARGLGQRETEGSMQSERERERERGGKCESRGREVEWRGDVKAAELKE